MLAMLCWLALKRAHLLTVILPNCMVKFTAVVVVVAVVEFRYLIQMELPLLNLRLHHGT
jgi:hypothetical protein